MYVRHGRMAGPLKHVYWVLSTCETASSLNTMKYTWLHVCNFLHIISRQPLQGMFGYTNPEEN